MKFNPGRNLYELYRKNPPARHRTASHVRAYWDGYEGRPSRYVPTSYGSWAWKAGRDNRSAEVKEGGERNEA